MTDAVAPLAVPRAHGAGVAQPGAVDDGGAGAGGRGGRHAAAEPHCRGVASTSATTFSRRGSPPTSCSRRCATRKRRSAVMSSPPTDGSSTPTSRASAPNRLRPPISGSWWPAAPKLIADLDAIERASAAWRTDYAEPLIAGVTPGAPSLVTNATAERGKAQFDRFAAVVRHPERRSVGGPGRHGPRTGPGAGLAGFGAGRNGRGVLRDRDPAGGAGAPGGQPSAGRAGRGVPADHRRQLRRHHRRARAQRPAGHRDRCGRHATADRRGTGTHSRRGTLPSGRSAETRPWNCAGPTRNWSSSPTSLPMICRSRCARSHRFASC